MTGEKIKLLPALVLDPKTSSRPSCSVPVLTTFKPFVLVPPTKEQDL